MACNEYETQQIVAHVIIGFLLRRWRRGHQQLRVVRDGLVLALQEFETPQLIKRAILGGYHQPGSRVVWNAGRRPLFEVRHHPLLRHFPTEAHIPQPPPTLSNNFTPYHPSPPP